MTDPATWHPMYAEWARSGPKLLNEGDEDQAYFAEASVLYFYSQLVRDGGFTDTQTVNIYRIDFNPYLHLDLEVSDSRMDVNVPLVRLGSSLMIVCDLVDESCHDNSLAGSAEYAFLSPVARDPVIDPRVAKVVEALADEHDPDAFKRVKSMLEDLYRTVVLPSWRTGGGSEST